MALPANAVAAAAVSMVAVAMLVALACPAASEPVRTRRSPQIEPTGESGYLGDEFARYAEEGMPSAAYEWVNPLLDHMDLLAKKAELLTESLGQKMGSRRAEDDDDDDDDDEEEEEELDPEKKARKEAKKARKAAKKARKAAERERKAKEEAEKVAAMQQEIKQTTDAMTQMIAEATKGFGNFGSFFRRKRSAPYWDAMEQTRAAMEASYAASLPGLQQMNELIRISNGAPLHTVRLPGFPSQLFQPGRRMALPGLNEGLDFGQKMIQWSMQLNSALNGGLNGAQSIPSIPRFPRRVSASAPSGTEEKSE